MTIRNALARVAVALALLSFGRPTRGCSCTMPEPLQALLDAEAVFSGRVVAIRQPGEESGDALDYGGHAIDLDVLATWKGVTASRITILTPPTGGSCGFPFVNGESYLVYAYGDRRGPPEADLCSGTTELDHARDHLAQLGDPIPTATSEDVARSLIEQLGSENLSRRIAACNALALRPEAAAASVPRIVALLDPSRDEAERRSAASALGTLGAAASAAVPALARMLSDPDPDRGIEAADALRAIGPAAAPALPQLLATLNDDATIEALEERREHLPAGREDESRDLDRRLLAIGDRRDAVIRVFGAIGPAAGRVAIDATLAEVRNGDTPELASVLREMGVGPEAARLLVSDLIAAPHDPQSLFALEALGPDAVAAVPVLVKLLSDPERDVRSEAAAVLGAIGPGAAEAASTLIGALDEADIEELTVIDALASIGSPPVAPVLARAARGSDSESVRVRARRGLVAMGLDPDAVPPAAGNPHGRDQRPRPAMDPPPASVTAALTSAPRLSYSASLQVLGYGLCGRMAAHPRGLVGADFNRMGAALVDVASGREITRFESPDGGDSRARGYFGADVAVLGTTTLIAAPNLSGPAIECGAVFAFAAGESRGHRIDNPVPANGTRFGQTLAAGRDFFVAVAGKRKDAPGGDLLMMDADGKVIRAIDCPPGVEFQEGRLAVAGDRIAYAERILVGDRRPGQVLIFDAKLGTLVRTIRGPKPEDDDEFGCQLAVLDGDHLLVGARGRVHVVDMRTGDITVTVRDPEPPDEEESFPTALAPIDAGRFAACGGGDGRRQLYVFDRLGGLAAVARYPELEPPFRTWVAAKIAIVQGRLLVAGEDQILVYGLESLGSTGQPATSQPPTPAP